MSGNVRVPRYKLQPISADGYIVDIVATVYSNGVVLLTEYDHVIQGNLSILYSYVQDTGNRFTIIGAYTESGLTIHGPVRPPSLAEEVDIGNLVGELGTPDASIMAQQMPPLLDVPSVIHLPVSEEEPTIVESLDDARSPIVQFARTLYGRSPYEEIRLRRAFDTNVHGIEQSVLDCGDPFGVHAAAAPIDPKDLLSADKGD
jgi:hypothetical protein